MTWDDGRAVNEAIADIDRGRQINPIGTLGARKRTMAMLVEANVEDRKADGLDPIANKTVMDYREALRNVISHPAPISGVSRRASSTVPRSIAVCAISQRPG